MDRKELTRRLAARLEEEGGTPASHLVADEVWLAVVEGALDVAERLPTVRQLAIALSLSPRSIERAYAELERRGVIVIRPGGDTTVSLTSGSEKERERHHELASLCAETVRRAGELGFGLDDLLDALAEYRSIDHEPSDEDTSR